VLQLVFEDADGCAHSIMCVAGTDAGVVKIARIAKNRNVNWDDAQARAQGIVCIVVLCAPLFIISM
jgi:hypothetical protein